MPLKDAGKRKRNEICPSTPPYDEDVAQPTKKHKPETVTSTNAQHMTNNERSNATVVSPNEIDNNLSADEEQTTVNELIEENKSDDDNIGSTSNKERKKNDNAKSKNKKFKNKRNNKKAKVAQPSSKPVTPFDYSQVDFKKFQGGSKRNDSKNDVQTKFHRKVLQKAIQLIQSSNKTFFFTFQNKSNRGNKQFNKLLTFKKGPGKKS